MDCREAEIHISALYDGEDAPQSVARHIAECEDCRRVLNDYSKIGAELRLAATMQAPQLPPLSLPLRRNVIDFLSARVSLPRFVLAALLVFLVTATIAATVLHAQSRPLWFQFAYGLSANPEFDYKVARAGYDESGAVASFVSGSPQAAALRVRIESISDDDVVLRVRAVPPKFNVTSTGITLVTGRGFKISLDNVSAIHYKPGESLAIPIEGGGTVYLKGEIFDHQPKIAFGFPLEPSPEEMVVRSPVLTSEEGLVASFDGATSIADNDNQAVVLRPGGQGAFIFALKPFSGAVEGQANWGEITFKLEGHKYRLLAAGPVAGGEQPRTVWVSHDSAAKDIGSGWSLGSAPIPE